MSTFKRRNDRDPKWREKGELPRDLPVLYAISPGRAGWCDLVPSLAALLRAGHLVQVREKHLEGRELVALLREVEAAVAPGMMRRLLVSDRCDVALAFDGAGAHLPETSLPVQVARRLLGWSRLLGVSCHGEDRLREAAEAGADFATLSPIFPVSGKGPPLGPGILPDLALPRGLALYGLGGIGPETVDALRGSGFHGVAVIRAVFSSADPVVAARRLVERFRTPPEKAPRREDG